MDKKVHYKLHKVKKQWVTIAVASVALASVVGGLSATTSSVSADETQDKTVSQPNSDTTADLVKSTETTSTVKEQAVAIQTNTKDADILTPAKETNTVDAATTTNTQAAADVSTKTADVAVTAYKLINILFHTRNNKYC